MALIVAVLYFGLIELMLYDASRELAEARRFRARIVALTLAENGAELAAWQLTSTEVSAPPFVSEEDWQGSITGRVTKTPATDGTESRIFRLVGTGDAAGIVKIHANVDVRGRIEGTDVKIDHTFHSQ
jgi:hypothetical protein